MKIGPLTPEIMHGVSIPFGTKRQKSIYHPNISAVLYRTLPTFQHW